MSFSLLTSAFKSLNKISPAKWKGYAKGMIETQRTASSGAIGTISSGFQGLMTSLNPLQALIEPLSEIFSIWSDVISTSFTPIIDSLFEILLSPTVMTLLETIGGLFSALFEAISPIIEVVGEIIGIFIEMINVALAPLLPIIEAFTPIFEMIADVIRAVLLPVLEVLTPIFKLIGTILEKVTLPLLKAIIPIFKALSPLFGVFNKLLEPIIPILEMLIPLFEIIGDVIERYVIPAIEFLIGIFSMVVTFIVDVIGGAIQLFFNIIKGIINGIIGIVNFVIGIINGVIRIVTLGLGPQIPTIPALAEGGLALKPTLAMIGDKPEAIIPLDRLPEITNNNTNVEFQLRELNHNILLLIDLIKTKGSAF